MKEKARILPLEEITLPQILRRTARRFPERPALEYDKRVWSYRDIERETAAMAAGLLSLGVKKGDHVAIWSEMSPKALLWMYAVQRMGAVAVVLHAATPTEEVAGRLAQTDAVYLAVGEKFMEKAGSLSCLLRVRGIFSLGEDGPCIHATLAEIMKRGERQPPEILEAAENAISPQDSALILFTSGSTGKPKAVVTSHHSRVNSGMQQAYDLNATETDRFCTVLPMFHCFSISANFMAAMSVGACIYLAKGRHTEDIIEAFRYGKCTILHAVPTQFVALIQSPLMVKEDFKTLRIGIIGGGGYSTKLFRMIEQALDFTLMSSLGQTEATAGITISYPDDSFEIRSTTVGHFMSHVEGKIVNWETGEDLPLGEIGEICVRGYVVMKGYYGAPEQTAQAIDPEGWLHTGDLGYIDCDGNLHLTDRLKNLIIRGGENISPAEVEMSINDLDDVRDSRVVGVPDPYYGEEVCAFVIRKPDSDITEEQLKKAISGTLEYFKLPKHILFIESFPVNDVGKIDILTLRKVARETLNIRE